MVAYFSFDDLKLAMPYRLRNIFGNLICWTARSNESSVKEQVVYTSPVIYTYYP